MDPFILTLCRLAQPVTIRPSTAPQLKRFNFFTSRTRQSNGGQLLHLHMGYFATLEEAHKWARLLRPTYPHATAMRAPDALLRKRDAAKALTDTQVLAILEERRMSPIGNDVDAAHNSAQIALLRPEDTATRHRLKEAVTSAAPVWFAVQLRRSAQPFDLTKVPSLSIFRMYTLFAAKGHRDGRPWHSLCLGFFSDAISAKQVAYYVRSTFESVAVVAMTEDEHARAFQNPIALASLAPETPPQAPSQQNAPNAPARAIEPHSPPASAGRLDAGTRSTATRTRRKSSLDETLEMLAASESWNDEESFGETGVRHLKVEFQKTR